MTVPDRAVDGSSPSVGRVHAIPTRRLLLRSGVGTVGAISGVLALQSAGRAHGTLASHNELNGDPTHYEIGGVRSAFAYRPTFYTRMEEWEEFYYNNTPTNWLRPFRIDTFGVHVDKGSEAHDNGRGFDIAQIFATINGSLNSVAHMRYDLWKNTGGATTKARYWAAAASLHYHFRHVLTYFYNSAHHDHIHIDNLVSVGSNSEFETNSNAQVEFVQATLRYVWGYSLPVDGVWDTATRNLTADAIARAGGSGNLTTSQSNWLLFNRASTRFGTGRQAY